jgi:hypothetical protein
MGRAARDLTRAQRDREQVEDAMRSGLKLLLVAAATVVATGAPRAEQRGQVTRHDELTWKPLVHGQPVGGPTMHVLWGNPATGPSGILVKLTADSELPMHVHGAAYQAVVISGTWIHGFGKEEPIVMTAGDTWTQPAKQEHFDKCRAGDDCVALLHVLGKFDVRPVKRGIAAPR